MLTYGAGLWISLDVAPRDSVLLSLSHSLSHTHSLSISLFLFISLSLSLSLSPPLPARLPLEAHVSRVS